MNKINTLKYLLGLQGTSGNEKYISRAIMGYLKNIKNPYHKSKIEVHQDDYLNVWGEVSYGDEDIVIGLNAHLDTVVNTQENRTVEFYEQSQTFRAFANGSPAVLGADDRAGVFAVLQLLESNLNGFEGKVKFFFTTQEEVGCFGAYMLDYYAYEDVDVMMVFDRKGSNDIVVGTEGRNYCGFTLSRYLESMGHYKAVIGGISDAYAFSQNGIQSVNLSVGYYNEHTDEEYLKYNELMNTIEFSKDIIAYMHKVIDDVRNDEIIQNDDDFEEFPQRYAFIDDEQEYGVEVGLYNEKVVLNQDGNEITLSKEMVKKLMEELEWYNG